MHNVGFSPSSGSCAAVVPESQAAMHSCSSAVRLQIKVCRLHNLTQLPLFPTALQHGMKRVVLVVGRGHVPGIVFALMQPYRSVRGNSWGGKGQHRAC